MGTGGVEYETCGDDIKILNMNEAFMNALEKIKQKGVVYDVCIYYAKA